MSIRAYIASAIAIVSALLSGFCVRSYYLHQIDEIKAVHAEAIAKAKDENIKGLANATDSILLADKRYSSLLNERNDLLARLRNSTRTDKTPDSLNACRTRNADLGNMVQQLSGLVEECNSGWHGCAKRKDALIEVVK
jgi:hypothetical protein